MVFTSFQYLLAFLPIVIVLCLFIKRFSHNAVIIFLIIASFIFYGTWNPKYLILLIGSILFNYSVGKVIEKSDSKKLVLIAGVCCNIALLGYFKYTNFFVDSFNAIFRSNYIIEHIVLPLAISFFTFQQIAWLMDKYHGESPECTFLEYCCAVSFFPHLIAGPIVQYHDLIPQLQSRKSFTLDWKNILNGCILISAGTFKKIIIADTLAFFASKWFGDPSDLNALQAWFGLFAYTMQIFFDFSGYCDIALGSALLLGIRLPINFNDPYRSYSVRDFWRRWHITLGYFLAKYVYIPLGGSRKGIRRTCINLLIIMFISGFWHGAGVCFILWGLWHGVGMVVNRLYEHFELKLIPKRLCAPLTFLFTSLAWVFFRAKSFDDALSYFRALFSFQLSDLTCFVPRELRTYFAEKFSINAQPISDYLGLSTHQDFRILCYALVSAFIVVFAVPNIQQIFDKYVAKEKWYSMAISLSCLGLLMYSFWKMIAVPYTEFIYFNF